MTEHARTLAELRAANLEAWRRDCTLGDWPIVANCATAWYVPELEAAYAEAVRVLRCLLEYASIDDRTAAMAAAGAGSFGRVLGTFDQWAEVAG